MLIREDDLPCIRETPSIKIYEGKKSWFQIEGLLKNILNRPGRAEQIGISIPRFKKKNTF